MRSICPIYIVLFGLLVSCDRPAPQADALLAPPTFAPRQEVESQILMVPLVADSFGYAATDAPTEVFRFEYHFDSPELTFTVQANQLNERVFCEIVYADGDSESIELYVNQYRNLVADLIATVDAADAIESAPSEADRIEVQSIAKTHRLEATTILPPASFVKWVSAKLGSDQHRELYRQNLSR